MFAVRYCLLATCALLAIDRASAQENGPPPGSTTTPQISANDARELAEWARQHANQSGGESGTSGISTSDVEFLQSWAEDQGLSASPRAIRESPKPVMSRNPLYLEPQPAVQLKSFQLEGTRPLPTTAAAQQQSSQIPAPLQNQVQFNGALPAASQQVQGKSVLTAQLTENTETASSNPPEKLISPQIMAVDENGNEILSDDCGCGDVCCGPALVAGIEGLFLAPISEPTQQVTLTNLLNNGAATGNGDPGFGAGIRVWLGMENCGGWGYRVRYTHFGNNALIPDPVVPVKAAASAFNQSYYLNLNVVDLELTQRFDFCCFESFFSIGGRYARLERNASVVGYGTQGGVDLMGLAVGANEMEGSGLTFSIGARKPFSPCNLCGWNLIGNFRGSVLWADASNLAFSDATAAIKDPVVATAQARNQASASSDGNSEALFVAEAQLGLEYQRPLKCHRAVFFFRAMAEYQHWQTGDVVASSESFAFLQGAAPDFGGRVDVSSNASDGDLDLIGFTLATGITY